MNIDCQEAYRLMRSHFVYCSVLWHYSTERKCAIRNSI